MFTELEKGSSLGRTCRGFIEVVMTVILAPETRRVIMQILFAKFNALTLLVRFQKQNDYICNIMVTVNSWYLLAKLAA
jgi:hypothetical protein